MIDERDSVYSQTGDVLPLIVLPMMFCVLGLGLSIASAVRVVRTRCAARARETDRSRLAEGAIRRASVWRCIDGRTVELSGALGVGLAIETRAECTVYVRWGLCEALETLRSVALLVLFAAGGVARAAELTRLRRDLRPLDVGAIGRRRFEVAVLIRTASVGAVVFGARQAALDLAFPVVDALVALGALGIVAGR